MTTQRGSLCATAIAACMLVGTAKAVTVPTAALPTGTVLDSLSTPINATGQIFIGGPNGYTESFSFVGTLDQQVLRQDNGTLAFTYQFHITTNNYVNDPLQVGVAQLVLGNFASAATPTLYVAPGSGGLVPNDVLYTVGNNTILDTRNFQPLSDTDLSTRAFFITTTATAYDAKGFGQITFINAPNVPDVRLSTFEAVSSAGPIPEPMSLALLPLALSALVLRRRL